MNRAPLTDTQARIYHFVIAFREREGYSPTLQEIGDALGYNSRSTVHTHVSKLVEKGYLQGVGRSLRAA